MKPLWGLVFGVLLLCSSGLILPLASNNFATVTEVTGSSYSYVAKTRTEFAEGSLIFQIITMVFMVVGLIGFLLVVVSVFRLIEPETSTSAKLQANQPVRPGFETIKKPPELAKEATKIRPTKFCRQCGAKTPRESTFCEECGTKLI